MSLMVKASHGQNIKKARAILYQSSNAMGRKSIAGMPNMGASGVITVSGFCKRSGMLFDLWNIRRLNGPNQVDDLMRAYLAYLASGGKTRVPSAVQDMFFEEELYWQSTASS